jgi:hypothetical protein
MSIGITPNLQTQPTQSPDELFIKKFTETAYSILGSKFAELLEYIITLKVLETDLDTNTGLGVFILDYQGVKLYIPVVLTDGTLNNMDIMYDKEHNKFLPLKKEWLEELSRTSLDSLGVAGEPPANVSSNQNIRNLTRPPLTSGGRYGYASHEIKEDELHINYMYKRANTDAPEIKPVFLEVIKQASPKALTGMRIAFERNPKFVQKLAGFFGIDNIKEAFNTAKVRHNVHEKLASSLSVNDEKLQIIPKDAPLSVIKETFGKYAASVYPVMREVGYAYTDTRRTKNRVVKVQPPISLEIAPASGWARVYFTDGAIKSGCFFKLSENQSLFINSSLTEYLTTSYDERENLLASPYVPTGKEPLYEYLKKPVNFVVNKIPKDVRYFLHTNGRGVYEGIRANLCKEELRSTTRLDGVVLLHSPASVRSYFIDPSYKKNKIMEASRELTYLPHNTVAINSSQLTEIKVSPVRHSTIHNGITISNVLDKLLLGYKHLGGKTPAVKRASVNTWWVRTEGKTGRTCTQLEALYKVAVDYSIPIEDADLILKYAQEDRIKELQVMPGVLFKYADPSMGGEMPIEQPTAEEMPPGEMPPGEMPPGEMPPAPPTSPMSATDLAIGEMVQQLSEQSKEQAQQVQSQIMQLQQQMEMQQSANQQLVSTLQHIQQRANEIDGATQGQIPVGAEQSPAVAAQALAPRAPEASPEQSPPPVMTQDSTSPELIAQQINPERAEQAADLNSAGVFDTAAVNMLSHVPVYQDILITYLPGIEQNVDTLGRLLLSLRMKSTDLKQTLGDEPFVNLEEQLRSLFSQTGDVVLKLKKIIPLREVDSGLR